MREVIEAVVTVLKEGDTDYAVALLEDVLEKESKETVAGLVSEAVLAVRSGDTDAVRTSLRAALEAVGDDGESGVDDEQDEVDEAEWSAAQVNDLPDSSFAFIEPGGKKDKDGKTFPRKLRHLPIKDASGKVDMPHLLVAMGRANQIKMRDGSMISPEKAKALRSHMRSMMKRGSHESVQPIRVPVVVEISVGGSDAVPVAEVVESETSEHDDCDGNCPYEHAAVITESSGELISETFSGQIEEALAGADNVYRVTLIEAGMSKNRNYWSPQLLQSHTKLFHGVKAFADHPTLSEMKERPERSVKDIIGWYDNPQFFQSMNGGKVKATLHLMDGPVADIIRQAHAQGKPDLIQLSVNISGRRQPKMMNGTMAREVTEIHRVHSVDAVTEASAGGSIDQLVASEKTSKEVEELMSLDNISAEDLLAAIEGRDDLKQAVATKYAPTEGSQETTVDTDPDPAPEAEAVEEAAEIPADPDQITQLTEAVGQLQQERALQASQAMIEKKLAETHLPEPVKAKVRKRHSGEVVSEQVLEAELEEEKDTLDAMAVGQPPASVPWSDAGSGESQYDQWGKAMDGLLSGKPVDGVRPFQHIRHAFHSITGTDPFGTNPYSILAEAARYDSGDWNANVGKRMLEAGPMVTGDFAAILGDSITRRALAEYAMPQLQEWRRIASPGNVSDLRQQKRERLGEFPLLQRGTGAGGSAEDIAAYADLTENPLPEEEAIYTPLKAQGKASLTIEMIINDDIGKFRTLPQKLGRAAAGTIYVTVFDFLILNPAESTYLTGGLTDRLFDTAAARAPGNLVGDVATAAQALNDANLTDAKKRFRSAQAAQSTATYTGARNHSYILADPRLLIVSPENEAAARRLLTSDMIIATDFAQSASTVGPSGNIHKGTVDMMIVNYWQQYGNVVTDGNTVDAKDMWFLVADPGDIPMIEVGFLGGREEPEIFTQDMGTPLVGEQFTRDRITYKVRHFWGANPVDHRGMVGTTGA